MPIAVSASHKPTVLIIVASPGFQRSSLAITAVARHAWGRYPPIFTVGDVHLSARKPPCSDALRVGFPAKGSEVNLFGKRECVIDLDPKVSDGALELAMTEEELAGA